jgi:hypothetical protein
MTTNGGVGGFAHDGESAFGRGCNLFEASLFAIKVDLAELIVELIVIAHNIARIA